MSGVIRLREVLLNSRIVVEEYGFKVYLVCIWCGITFNHRTFLSIIR